MSDKNHLIENEEIDDDHDSAISESTESEEISRTSDVLDNPSPSEQTLSSDRRHDGANNNNGSDNTSTSNLDDVSSNQSNNQSNSNSDNTHTLNNKNSSDSHIVNNKLSDSVNQNSDNNIEADVHKDIQENQEISSGNISNNSPQNLTSNQSNPEINPEQRSISGNDSSPDGNKFGQQNGNVISKNSSPNINNSNRGTPVETNIVYNNEVSPSIHVLDNHRPASAVSNSSRNNLIGNSYRQSSIGESDQFVIFKSYKRRFWILFLFSLLACLQCVEWNTWGPIEESISSIYSSWGSGTVAMMGNWGTIMFVIFIFPLSWVAQTKGLRIAVLICAGVVSLGTLLRCFTRQETVFTIMCHLCAILVGTAGTLVMAAPPYIATTWFPPKERITAVATMQICNQLGNLGAYLEPLIVREPESGATPQEISDDIARLMYISAGVSAGLFIAMLIYYPAKPPTPPSVSSSIERVDFKTTLKKMIRNRNLLLVILSYSMALGPTSTWMSVLNYSLQDINFDQNEAMWIGILSVVVSGCAAFITGRLTDLIYGHIKASLIVLIFLSASFYYWFYLITYGTIPLCKWQVFVSVIAGISFNFSASPLFFELAVEVAYPLPEGVVAGFATCVLNFVGIIFLFIFQIPSIGYEWVVYLLISATSLAAVPLLLIEETYARSSIDRGYAPSPYQAI